MRFFGWIYLYKVMLLSLLVLYFIMLYVFKENLKNILYFLKLLVGVKKLFNEFNKMCYKFLFFV